VTSPRAHTLFPTSAECRGLQAALCERFGGDTAETDPGLLESLLVRPRSPHYGTLAQQAAALLSGFARQPVFESHPERFAMALTACFLHAHGYRLDVEPAAARHFLTEHVVGRQASVRRIAERIERAMVPLA